MNKCKVMRLFKGKELVAECKYDTVHIREMELNHKDIKLYWMGIYEHHLEYDQDILANGGIHISNGILDGEKQFDSFEIGMSDE